VTTSSGQLDLGAILAAVPVRMTVATPEGATLYDNGAAVPEPVETLRRDVVAAGVPYAVTLGLDGKRLRALEDTLFERSYVDGPTGLPNRAFAAEAVADLVRDGTAFAVAVVEIDGLRRLGDYYGAAAAEGLVGQAGERLAAAIGAGDLVARLGDDGFVLVLQAPGDDTALAARLAGLGAGLGHPCHVDSFEVLVSASVGAARAPVDGRDLDTLVRRCRQAMHDGGARPGSVHIHSAGDRAADEARTRMEQRLRLAIRDRRVCCVVQPKVDFRRDVVVGVEVLMRWRDDDGLIHPPGGMAELAGEIGLIDALTEQVVDEAIAALPLIDGRFGPDTSVSVNVAARQAGNVAYMRGLADRFVATGRPDRFFVEVTEEALLAAAAFQRDVLPLLRAAGIRLSIDDFGVGYSSLATLADLAADEVKIDRSFITAIHTRPRGQFVLAAIDRLGQSLGATLVAEGVETADELAHLRSATAISVAQGYYFSRPQLLEAFAAAPAGRPPARPAISARPSPEARSGAPPRK
jgi:diguanylate cyclase (GGDEF)-like protein